MTGKEMSEKELLAAILQKLSEKTFPVEIDLWDTEHVAAYLKRSYSTVRDQSQRHPGALAPAVAAPAVAAPAVAAPAVAAPAVAAPAVAAPAVAALIQHWRIN
jgi:hypothetical protein